MRRNVKLDASARELFDYAVMGGQRVPAMQVWEPRWYDVRRWWIYWRSSTRGTVTITHRGKPVTLRTIGHPGIKR